MKKVKFIVSLLLILIVTVGCKQSSENRSVSITTDRETYATIMSSVQGITLSAVISNGMSEKEIVYEWIASDGIFIKTMSDHITNNGNSVLWNPINLDSTLATGTTTITLDVRDRKTNNILAKNSLKIEFDNQMYRVIK